jgi:hypothetical protein
VQYSGRGCKINKENTTILGSRNAFRIQTVV